MALQRASGGGGGGGAAGEDEAEGGLELAAFSMRLSVHSIILAHPISLLQHESELAKSKQAYSCDCFRLPTRYKSSDVRAS
eukprot:650906-Pleurochrysis_carterae.AAC.1